MIGEASGIVPDRGLNILYRVTLNTLMNLTEDGLTQDNLSTTQAQNNTRLGADTPKGLLAGSVVKVGSVSGTVEAAVGAAGEPVVGVIINNAVGYPFESSSGVASGKAPYIHGAGTVFTTDLYETDQAAAPGTAITYAAGDELYASQNGLLTNEHATADVVVGIVLIAPSASDPFMAVQMRI